MLRRLLSGAIFAGLIAAIVGWFLSAPSPLDETRLAALGDGDAVKGETVFWAGGCSSCHAKATAKGEEKLVLGGGVEFKTAFGTFKAPNISPSQQGIGSWTKAEFANAMLRGVSPENQHYYPAFPFTSYAKMSDTDIADLWAYMKTLPGSEEESLPHEMGFPFNIRRGLGLWKLLFFDESWVLEVDEANQQLVRGRYLVEGAAHCGACHTPRNLLGGMDKSRWLAGGPAPEGEGRIPNITPHESGIGSWSLEEIESSLESGFTPSFDSFGGSMTSVQENMAKLSKADRLAISAYLKAVSPVASEK